MLLKTGYHDFAASRGYYAMFSQPRQPFSPREEAFPGMPQLSLPSAGISSRPDACASDSISWVEEFLGEIAEFLKSQGYQLGSAP